MGNKPIGKKTHEKKEKISCSRSDMSNFYIINHKVHRFSISARSEHPETYFSMALEK